MIHADISIYPIATKTTSVSFYIAKAIESIQNIEKINFTLHSMGTTLESKDMSSIYEAITNMTQTVHNLGVSRVCTVIKIDSRLDKDHPAQQKIESVKKHIM